MSEQLQALAALLVAYVPEEILAEFEDYVNAGEPKVGIEALCDALYDAGVPLRPKDVVAIQAAGRQLGVTRRSFVRIGDLVEK
jgi:hypothetical protein